MVSLHLEEFSAFGRLLSHRSGGYENRPPPAIVFAASFTVLASAVGAEELLESKLATGSVALQFSPQFPRSLLQ